MKTAIQVLVVALLLIALAACQGAALLSVMKAQTAKAITVFSFASPAATGTIDENAKTIKVIVPYGTNVTALVATFTTTGSGVKVGSKVQVSGTTANNFSNPVIYTLTAADGSAASYTVTVATTPPASSKAITAFSFSSVEATGTIDEAAKIITVKVPYGTNVTGLVATFTNTGSSINVGSTVQVSGATANNFSNPVIYAVTAQDGSIASYVVTVTAIPWHAVGTAGFSAGAVWGNTSLAIDTTGTLYVAYGDGGNGNRATVMKYGGGSWQTVGTAGFSEGWAAYISLAIDSTGTPYVAYTDLGNYWKATVMKYAGGSWQTVGSAGFSPGRADYISLAIDSSCTPYIAYSDDANGYKAMVMKYAGGWWQTVGAAGLSAGEAWGTSLAIDPIGTPYVSYTDCANGSKATVMKFAGGSWQTVGTAGLSRDGVGYTSLAFDSIGTPYVACDEGKATVMKYASGSWKTLGSAGFSAGGVLHISLGIGSTGTLHVTYEDYANNSKATVMKYAGGSWQVVGTAGLSAGEVWAPSLVVDSTDTPYVSYGDVGSDGRVTVMRFK